MLILIPITLCDILDLVESHSFGWVAMQQGPNQNLGLHRYIRWKLYAVCLFDLF